MSRDFSPKMCWIVNESSSTPENPHGIYLSNILWKFQDKEEWMYTEEELSDRIAHKYLAVMGADIYKQVRKMLSEEKFERLNNLLGQLIEADFGNKGTSDFPKEITDWYYNRNGHYYHEPNDEELIEYLKKMK